MLAAPRVHAPSLGQPRLRGIGTWRQAGQRQLIEALGRWGLVIHCFFLDPFFLERHFFQNRNITILSTPFLTQEANYSMLEHVVDTSPTKMNHFQLLIIFRSLKYPGISVALLQVPHHNFSRTWPRPQWNICVSSFSVPTARGEPRGSWEACCLGGTFMGKLAVVLTWCGHVELQLRHSNTFHVMRCLGAFAVSDICPGMFLF